MSAVLPLTSPTLESQLPRGGSFLKLGDKGGSQFSQAEDRLLAFDKRVAPTLDVMDCSPVINSPVTTAKRIAAITRRIKGILGTDFSIVPNQAFLTSIFPESDPRSVAFQSFSQAIFACSEAQADSLEQSYSATVGIFGDNNMVTICGSQDWFKNRAIFLLSIQKIQSTIDTLVRITDKGMSQINNEALVQENQILKTKILTDPLTGISNRGAMNIKLQELKKNNIPVYGIMCDIDYFKKVNDTHGHGVGDIILQQVSMLLATEGEKYFALKNTDRLFGIPGNQDMCSIFRMGGEEFCFLIAGIGESGAYAFAEYIRQLIADYQFIYPIPGKPMIVNELGDLEIEGTKHNIGGLDITVSMGISYASNSSEMDTILENADIALYNAKNSGRNRVVKFDNQFHPIISSHVPGERRDIRV